MLELLTVGCKDRIEDDILSGRPSSNLFQTSYTGGAIMFPSKRGVRNGGRAAQSFWCCAVLFTSTVRFCA